MSPREAAIVGHGLLEAALEKVLQKAIKARSGAKPDSLIFDQGGILSSYYALITIGHAFGCIPTILHGNLVTIGAIRNAFAHSVIHLDFDALHREIDKKCASLNLPETYHEISAEIAHTMDNVSFSERPEDGIILADKAGFIGAQVLFNIDDLATNRGRFIVSVKLAWILLTVTGFSNDELSSSPSSPLP